MAILRVYNPLTESWDPIPYIKGDKGDRGYDVTTVEYEYYSSTSSSEPTGGEWSTIMPGYSEGRYIWVRTKTTNSHGEVYTGTPVLATLFNDVNSAELTRRTYETNRVNAETARDTAEGLRDSAEIARASAELLRVSAETSRGNSEVSRANAEAQRVSAESSRVSVEAQRVANEDQRILNENARIAAQGRYPIVQNSTWWVWSKEDDDYVDTEVTAVGADGVGIASIELTSTVDLVDTYTITFDDGSTTTFDVTNGQDGISPTITVTEITGGHEVEVVDAQGTQTFDVMDGEVSEQDLEDALIDKADIITSSASGEIVSISDGGKDLPVVDLKVSLLPVQSGSGDPSPSNIRPISGWTGVDVYQSGKNMLDNQLVSGTYNGCTITKNADGSITVSGTPSAQTRRAIHSGSFWDGKTNGNISFGTFPSGTRVFARRTNEYGTVTYPTLADSLLDANAVYDQLYLEINTSYNGTLFTIYPQIELGSTKTAYEPYNGTTYPISWQSSAGTVYGGSLDVTTGVLTVDKGIATFNGSEAWYDYPLFEGYYTSLSTMKRGMRQDGISNMLKDSKSAEFGQTNAMWLGVDSRYVFAIGVHDSMGDTLSSFKEYLTEHPLQIVYPLDIPLVYQLDPIQIATFLGTNNFWSNGNGVVDLEYRADTKLYIEQLTKPSEDDMIANANIASGKFFMVGNRLMLSTTAIAQGEQIVVGTNCTEVSLADALNQINA